MDLIDAEVLTTLKDDILRPTVVEQAITLVLAELTPEREDERRAQLEAELATASAECERLADAIMRGGSLDVLVSRLRARQERHDQIKAGLWPPWVRSRPTGRRRG